MVRRFLASILSSCPPKPFPAAVAGPAAETDPKSYSLAQGGMPMVSVTVSPDEDPGHPGHGVIGRVSQAIRDNPDCPLDVAALSMLVEMSPLHLEREFHRCHGASLREYARRERDRQSRERDGEGPRSMDRNWLIAAL